MTFQPFGRHLHNQIVIPLLLGYLCVAVIATFVAVFQLRGLVDGWVTGTTIAAAEDASQHLEKIADELRTDAGLVAEDGEIRAAIADGDWGSIHTEFARLRRNLRVDDLVLLDDRGVVVAVDGALSVENSDTALAAYSKLACADHGGVWLARVGGADMIVSAQPSFSSGAGKQRATVVATYRITWDSLRREFSGMADAVGYCDTSGALRARYVDRHAPNIPRGLKPAADAARSYPAFAASISMTNGSIGEALRTPGRAVRYDSIGQQFTVRSVHIPIPYGDDSTPLLVAVPASGAARDPRTGEGTGSAHLFVVKGNAVATAAGNTASVLIAWWSLVAILVLTGLGTVIARRVSNPLTALSESARRVAEGDFSARVEVVGTNEVAEVASSFNGMTDSLRERTEALTKKVLELATLYEMSGALGSTLDMDVLLDSVLDSALRIFDVDSGYVMIRDKASGGLELRAWRGTALRPDDRAVRGSMSEWVVRQSRPLIYNPSPDGRSVQQIDAMTGALAALCVPLVASEGVIGAICVGSLDSAYRFASDDVRLLSTIANHVTIAIGNIELFSSLQDAYLATVRALAAAVDAKDPYTRGHSDRVSEYASEMARTLMLTTEQCTALEMAAFLHDIGKIGVREAILLKPGKLDDDEMAQMRHHPLIGANILRHVAFPWPIAPIVRHHHEHFDGEGYPAGLKGEEIPLLARILTVADAFEAMTSDRPYRKACSHQEAVDELKRCSGSHFDPRVVTAFMESEGDIPGRAVSPGGPDESEIQPEEARAILVAVCNGMFGSFRRLGGPRLASNLESTMDAYFTENSMPYRLGNGRLTIEWGESGSIASEIQDMRELLARMAEGMASVAGGSLVDHFYDEAIAGLSDRMRGLALTLKLYDRG